MYGVHRHLMPAPWLEWTGKITKKTTVDEVGSFFWWYDDSLAPSPMGCILALETPRSSSNSKTICSVFHQYKLISHLLEASFPLLQREDIAGTRHTPSWGFMYVTMERIWEGGMENPPQCSGHRYWSCNGKQSQERVLPGSRQFSRLRRWSNLISEVDNELLVFINEMNNEYSN